MDHKILLPFLISFLSCTLTFAQDKIRPSGDVISKEYDYSNFKGIRLSNDFKAYVTFTKGKEKVSIKVDDNLFKYIIIEMDGDILDIRLKNNLNIRGEETLKAFISARELKSLEADDDSEIYLENKLRAEIAEVILSDDSILKGEIEVAELDVRLSSDSVMKVSGKSNKVRAELKGDSVLEDFDFNIKKLKVSLKGDSVARLTVRESIDVKASGDSVFNYKGDADIVSMTVVGDSEIRKRD